MRLGLRIEYLRIYKRSGFQIVDFLGAHGLFEELGRCANRGGLHECPNCGLVWSWFSTFFLSVHHMVPRDKLLFYLLEASSSECV